MSNYRVFYWKIFNWLARVTGILFLLGGVAICLWFLPTLFDPSASINVNGFPSYEYGDKLISVVSAIVVAVFGWLMIRAPKYFPKHVKKQMEERRES